MGTKATQHAAPPFRASSDALLKKPEDGSKYSTCDHSVTIKGSRYNKGFAELIDNLRGEAGGCDPWPCQ
ncbi:hypothetical protein GCM10011400_21770 [Paraburkholderia caffeinilytica]|uniref:Uncharacterized protein n=1 Tax=Paraburkholderia caffeinilytica TaxID=1761016 RepID=A0ABQ1M4Y1_9BURK|nr:hypothetical protein GCM10011400_21770 [Paraburkholderia caffeinilytica]